MQHRIYDTIGYVDNKPGYIWLYSDDRVATRAPSDEDIQEFLIEVLKKYEAILATRAEITYSVIFNYLMTAGRYADVFSSNVASLLGKHELVWDRYIMPILRKEECNVKVFARH